MKKILFLLCFVQQVSVQAQSQQANDYYASLNYPMAIENYEKYVSKLKTKNDPDAEIVGNLANSYFFTVDYSKACKWYEKLYTVQGDGMDETLFTRMITCYRVNRNYERADELLKSYYKKNKLRLKMLAYQKNLLDSVKSNVNAVQNLKINTDKADFGPMFYGNNVVFSSSQRSAETSEELYSWNNQPYLNLFIATRNKNSGYLSNVKDFTNNLNSQYHDASVAFSKDLKTIFFTRNKLTKKNGIQTNKEGTSNIEIVKGTIDGNQISDIVALDFNDPEYSCGHPAISADGKYLFFVSNMPGGFGETDLYVARLYADGSTGVPVNLGDKVNTAGREMFPYMTGDTLYFASDGHYGLGGLDVFSTQMKGETNFSIPENLGAPINSNKDDFSFIFDGETRSGYFSSNRDGGKGDDDIYWFNLNELPKVVDYSGAVLDETGKNLVPGAKIQVYDLFNDLILETTSDDKGKYNLNLPCNAQFKAVFSKPEYSTESVNITTPTDAGAKDGNDVRLTSFNNMIEKEGDKEKIRVNPIYFDYGKWDITEKAVPELDKVLLAMQKFPDLKIKIESHTDSRGSDKYNLMLSDHRAKATRDYLISKGISPERIESATGYGETRPKNQCVNGSRCSDEDYAVNRRSDFIIISK
ncbi:OmpA family protein [Fluviicola sp.]|uniref:OmpA family protein n=1 Tax=Fluviicola sp. TaxID=1917219 RepID=UPI0031E1554E